MSEETVKTVLKDAGFTEKETEIYIFLAKHGPLKSAEIAKISKKDKAQVFRILKKLQTKGFVESTLDFPTRYTVIPFKNILEDVVKAKREEVDFIEKVKEDLIGQLRKKSPIKPILEKFAVIKGRKRIYSKIYRMFEATRHQINIVLTVSDLIFGFRFGVFDIVGDYSLDSQVQFRFLIELSKENLNSMKALLKKFSNSELNFRARTPELGKGLFPRMIIRDKEEILFFTSAPKPAKSNNEEVCLCTNSKSLVQTFTDVFDDLWHNSTNIQKRISEIETGKPISCISVINDLEEAKKKYEESIQSAEKEIMLITSSNNLIKYWKDKENLKNWHQKGISIRIMAPIVKENLNVATQISKICEVRHVPYGYPEVTIVDNKHYFQLKSPLEDKEKQPSMAYFDNTFYTNDSEYIEKIKNMFNDLWKKSHALSSDTLEIILKRLNTQQLASSNRKTSYLKEISGLSFKDWELRDASEKKDVLNKIITARGNKSKNPMRIYGSMGSAVIHPPDFFELPDMVITVFHIEKHSSFGEEDAILISLSGQTSNGNAYIPMAYIGDNPKAQTIWKKFMAGTPAAENVQLFKKDEIEIRIHGNTLFAAWTKEITLSQQYILPPSCLMMEGYGNIKTDSYTMISPSGYITKTERNGFEAFVTFFHPASKYSGPGTDGFFARDYTATTYPPSAQ